MRWKEEKEQALSPKSTKAQRLLCDGKASRAQNVKIFTVQFFWEPCASLKKRMDKWVKGTGIKRKGDITAKSKENMPDEKTEGPLMCIKGH